MNSANNNVYVIDPDQTVHDALTELLAADGTRVVCFRSAEDFLRSDEVNDTLRGCVLAEADLPGMGSLAFLRQLRTLGTGVPVIILTSTSNRDIANQALKAGAVDVISKPLVGDRILTFLRDLTVQNSESLVDKSGQSHA